MNEENLSHLDETGSARMVDLSGKAATERVAQAKVEIHLKPATLQLIRAGLVKKGDVLGVARVAAIQAAKRTPDWIPLCHPIRLNEVSVDFELSDSLPGVEILTTVKAFDRTGVEMEALTAAAAAALTIYDMIKAVDRAARIHNLRVVHKSGGASGEVNQP